MKPVLAFATAALAALSFPAAAGDGLGGCIGYHQVAQTPAPAVAAAAPSTAAPAMTPVPETAAAPRKAGEERRQTASTRVAEEQPGG